MASRTHLPPKKRVAAPGWLSRSLTAVLLFSLPSACVRAQFVPVDKPDAGGDGDPSSCPDPITVVQGCQAKDNSPCDPVCQSGGCAWCGQKCSLNSSGAAVCVARGRLDVGQTCTIFLEGTAQQRDECRAGALCLTPNVGGSTAYCFSLCRGAVDCPGGVACTPRPLGSSAAVAWVCDPEYVTCDPDLAAGCCDPLASDSVASGCGNGRFCYLATPDPAGHSRTMCDYATGGKGRGEACQSSRECLEKYVCVPMGAGGSGTCQRVCSNSKPCPGSTCIPMGSEFGYCPL